MATVKSKVIARRPAWADRLEAARIVRFASQADFARHIGLTPSRYGNYEQGTREPDFATLARIALALDLSIDWLLTGNARPPFRALSQELKSYGNQ